MQTFRFSFNGDQQLELPENGLAWECATDIVEGKAYPFPLTAKPQVVVDIGAHCGEFTIMAALIWPQAMIHAFEPHPDTCAMLRRNLSQFSNVVIHEQAVAAQAGRASLHLSTLGSVADSLHPQLHASEFSVPVEVVGPDVVRDLRPDILKIDAEGSEREIIEGMGEGVAQIERVYFEYHTEDNRLAICRILDRSHALCHARIFKPALGEMLYVRRE